MSFCAISGWPSDKVSQARFAGILVFKEVSVFWLLFGVQHVHKSCAAKEAHKGDCTRHQARSQAKACDKLLVRLACEHPNACGQGSATHPMLANHAK